MGNLCSKSSNETDPFSQPGRRLGDSAPSQPSSAPVPQKITSPGRTLGSSENQSGEDARGAAARAAEARANKGSKGGKLSSQLEAQKKQTRNELLNSGSEQERRARDADEAAQARSYN